MPTQKLLLDPQQQAADEFAADRRRTLAARDRFEAAADLADEAWPVIVPPSGQPGDAFLAAVRAALDADDPNTAAQLLRAKVQRIIDEESGKTGPAGGTAQRPKRYRKRMSRMAWLMIAMRLG